MSRGSSEIPTKGSWPKVWLVGAAVPFISGLLLLALLLSQIIDFSISLIPGFLLDVILPAAIVAAATSGLLVGSMRLVERRWPQSLPAWLLAGEFATSPVAIAAWWLSSFFTPHRGGDPAMTFANWPIPLFFYACGLLGAAVAFRIRHGIWFR